jgi:diguanylate cyclase (GGDEF)-like protein/PAS domain S-box-containing protein
MTLAFQRETFGAIDFSPGARLGQEEGLLMERRPTMIDSPFDASPIAQCLLDRKMRFAAVNRAMSTVLGASADDLLGCPAAIVVQGAEKMIEHAFGLAETGRAIPQRKVEWRERQYGLSFSPVRGATGRAEGLAVAAVDITRQWKIARRLRESRRKLLAKTQHDHLTGLLNRRGLEAKLNRELRRMRREQATISLLLLDIDAFKSFNDTFGHGAGDRCLEVVAAELRRCMRRPMDAACRYGGEEFAVILPNVDAQGAAVMAENCRKAVERWKIAQPESPYGQVTISVGAATISPAQDRASTAVLSSALLDAADSALYRAKAAGRNRCEMA